MIQPGVLILFLTTLAAAPPGAPAASGEGSRQDTRRPLALVGGDTLTLGDLDREISSTVEAAKGQANLTGLDPEAVLERLIQNRLLEQEGYRIKADQEPAVRNQVREFIRLQSVKALLDSISTLGPAAASPDTFVGAIDRMRRYSHILVKDEGLARSLRDSLNRGTPFADLARRHSVDGTAKKGGDLGWAAEGAYVDAFEQAARPLALREVAGPVQSEFGWHIITLTDARTDTLRSPVMANAMAEAQEKQRRMDASRKYVRSLEEKYAVTVDDSLLAGLDYASADPEVQRRLQTSEEVLAVVPSGRLTVRGLTRNIRFQYFHGLTGHADAGTIRNGLFEDWLTESLLSHEAHVLGLDRRPALLTEAQSLERTLVREETLKQVLTTKFEPSDAELGAFYQAHQKDFTPAPRVKVRSVLLADESTAQRFREQLDAGTGFKWLVERTPGAADSPPPYPSDWFEAARLPLTGGVPAPGTILGPEKLSEGWGVVQVAEVESTVPTPLSECRAAVLRAMRGEHDRQAIADAVAGLRAATRVTRQDGATATVARRLEYWRAAGAEGRRP